MSSNDFQSSTQRDQIVAFLEFIASLSFEPGILSIEAVRRLPEQLSQIWFDELYVPSKRYLDCLKGDAQEEKVQAFNNSLSEEEKSALEMFHHFFELRIEMTFDRSGQKFFGLESDAWQHIKKDAILALEAFGVFQKRNSEPLPTKSSLAYLEQWKLTELGCTA